MSRTSSIDDAVRVVKTLLKSENVDLNEENDPQALAVSLAAHIAQLDSALNALVTQIDATCSTRQKGGRLYRRALQDYISLEEQRTLVRAHVVNRPLFRDVMLRKGEDVSCVKRHLHFISALDSMLGNIIGLLEYDNPKRPRIDVRKGYEFRSGSVVFRRIYFFNLQK
jgi:hypothetical protein